MSDWSAVEMTDIFDADGSYKLEVAAGLELYFNHCLEKITMANLEIIILCILRTSPMCGYDLIKSIFEKYNIFLSQGTVYPLLYSLEGRGILTAELSQINMGSKIYSISAAGEEVVKDRLSEFVPAGEYAI